MSSSDTGIVAVSEHILNVYSNNLESLPAKERIHFTRRAYRITGSAEFADAIDGWTREHTVPAIRRRAKTLRLIAEDGKPFPKVSFKPSQLARARARNKLFSQRPELQFFRRYLMDLFQAQSFGADRTLLRDEWDEHMDTLQKFDFDAMYVDLEVLHKVSSFAVNSVIFLDKLGVDADLHRRFVGYLRGEYFEDDMSLVKEMGSRDFTSLVYNLTHVVIAESSFYQHWVTRYGWIGAFFAANYGDILERCSHDVIAEVGLCLKLLQLEVEHAEAFQAIVHYLINTYDFDASLSIEKLAAREHTNAVVMLLFAKVEEWRKGPYLT